MLTKKPLMFICKFLKMENGNQLRQNNMNFAQKVKRAYKNCPSLTVRQKAFKAWCYVAKNNPDKYTVSYKDGKFLATNKVCSSWAYMQLDEFAGSRRVIGDWIN